MSQVGVTVAATEVPASTALQYSTANSFVPVEADWGPVGQAIKTSSLANAASAFGTPQGSGNPSNSRTATNALAYDSADTLYHEDGTASPAVYYSRVVGPSPVNASLVLLDGSSATSLTLTAQYPGVGGNAILCAVVNNTSSYTLTLYDTLGNILAASPSLASTAAGVAWAATTGLVTAVAGAGTLPATLSATVLSGGTDNRNAATITNWQNALAVFSASLGPGQVFAPGITNGTLSGIWSALGTHSQLNNRVAICGMDDSVSASTLIADLGSFGSSGVASYCGFWAGSRLIPGIAAGTTRTVSPGPVIAALCARVDQAGNPNQAASGVNWPLVYATQPSSIVSGSPFDTYSQTDLNTLNGAGINTFQTANGLPCNYGFVSSELSTSDVIYWQFNHARLRMAIVAQSQILGQPFVFAQIDGQGTQAVAFKNVLQAYLQGLWSAGALYGATAAQAFTVDTGSDVNTPATISAGQLNASLTVSFSYFAQNVNITVNVVPITQAI
jgi:hypothetical protein